MSPSDVVQLLTGPNLVASAESSGQAPLLAEPALAFALGCPLRLDARADLQRALRPIPEASLRALLDPAAHGSPESLEDLHRSGSLFAILTAVRDFLSFESSAPGTVEARAALSPPPSDPEDLEAWLRATKVGGWATIPAVDLLLAWAPPQLVARLPKTTSLWALATGGKPPLLSEPERAHLQRSALALLHAKALSLAGPPRVPAIAGQGAARPLADPGLEPLEAAVLKAYDLASRVRSGEPPRPATYSIHYREEPFQFEWRGNYTRDPALITIDASHWSKAVVARCDFHTGGCDHGRAALASLVDWLHGDPSPAHARVAEILARPSWWKQLRQLDDLVSLAAREVKRQDEAALVVWKVSLAPNALVLEAVVRRLAKRGGWTAGARVDIERLPHEPHRWTFPNADRVLELYARPPQHFAPDDRPLRALKLLAGDPHLHLADRLDVPLEVRSGALEVELAVHKGRLRLAATVDGLPVDELVSRRRSELRPLPEKVEFLRMERQLVLLDHARGLCVLAELTETQERLLEGLKELERLPDDALADLAPRLGALERHLPLKLPPELEGQRIEADLRHLARLTPQADGSVDLELFVRPLGEGPVRAPGEDPRRLCGEVDGRRVHVVRDLAAEPEKARSLLAELKLEEGEGWRRTQHGDAALDLLALLEARADVVVEWPKDAQPLKIVGHAQAGALKVKLESKHDWFGLSGTVLVGEDQVALAVLMEAVRKGSRYVEVGKGRFALIADELRDRVKRASDVVFTGRGGLEVSLAGADALADLVDGAEELDACEQWRGAVERMKASKLFEPPAPEGLRADLRPYQLAGYRWLMRMAHWGVGACLADDMGLGKTVQALAALVSRKDRGPALVVAPTSVGFNWVRECEKFAPGLKPIVFREGDRAATLKALGPGDVLVTSYGLLHLHAADLAAVHFGTLVLDEAQAIKNPATRRAKAARDLDAEWRLGLTGTPMENHLGELWSLLRVLTPGLLGSWDQFRDRFATPIERQKDPARRQALSKVVRPFILRRGKAEVAPELPPRTDLKRLVTLSAEERRLYEDARLAAVAELSGVEGESERFSVLAALTRLRQLACHPRLADEASKVPSSKLAALLELVAELREEGHRALVFSQFTSHLALVREALQEEGVRLQYLDGATPEAERARRVDAFQRGEGEVFLISLKAGGTGLNLTGADYVIHLDPWWNPAVEDQASDRAHRIGQTRPVTVYRLVATGTIEEAILTLHEEKRDLVSSVLDGTAKAAKLTTAELLSLIKAGEGAPEGDEGEELDQQ